MLVEVACDGAPNPRQGARVGNERVVRRDRGLRYVPSLRRVLYRVEKTRLDELWLPERPPAAGTTSAATTVRA